MGLLWALVIGFIVGVLAKVIMPGRDRGGIIVTSLLGIAGSMLALGVGRALDIYDAHQEGPGMIASILGAVAVLAAYRAIVMRRRLI